MEDAEAIAWHQYEEAERRGDFDDPDGWDPDAPEPDFEPECMDDEPLDPEIMAVVRRWKAR
jgi:hypothetical protein